MDRKPVELVLHARSGGELHDCSVTRPVRGSPSADGAQVDPGRAVGGRKEGPVARTACQAPARAVHLVLAELEAEGVLDGERRLRAQPWVMRAIAVVDRVAGRAPVVHAHKVGSPRHSHRRVQAGSCRVSRQHAQGAVAFRERRRVVGLGAEPTRVGEALDLPSEQQAHWVELAVEGPRCAHPRPAIQVGRERHVDRRQQRRAVHLIKQLVAAKSEASLQVVRPSAGLRDRVQPVTIGHVRGSQIHRAVANRVFLRCKRERNVDPGTGC
mmetsp:Transcript_55326/g.129476  ORF Transcript_55326/g.129476 Transcript_55326/m.129476 type:complete len:269 (+) Transcript_55326:389-1195(+)